jgi:hypothetical protein
MLMAPPSQELEPPANPGRFNVTIKQEVVKQLALLDLPHLPRSHHRFSPSASEKLNQSTSAGAIAAFFNKIRHELTSGDASHETGSANRSHSFL